LLLLMLLRVRVSVMGKLPLAVVGALVALLLMALKRRTGAVCQWGLLLQWRMAGRRGGVQGVVLGAEVPQ